MTRGLQIALPFDAPSDPPVASTRLAIAPTDEPVVPPPCVIAPSRSAVAPTVHALAPVYFVRHRRARRYLLRVDADGRLRITIPRGGSRREAEAFALRNRDWVTRQRGRERGLGLTAAERSALRARAAEELPVRLGELAAEHAVTGLTRVSIRNQRTRWGSCGPDGHISLNWRLALMPPDVRDYVLIHELMHLRRMDHSPAYWALVAAACPAYADARAWLRKHGHTLR